MPKNARSFAGGTFSVYEKLQVDRGDPFTRYIIASHFMHMEPTHPAGNARVAFSYDDLGKPSFFEIFERHSRIAVS